MRVVITFIPKAIKDTIIKKQSPNTRLPCLPDKQEFKIN